MSWLPTEKNINYAKQAKKSEIYCNNFFNEHFSDYVILNKMIWIFLTLWKPAYDIFVLQFQPKTSSFRLPYQCHSSSAYCTRDLFKGSNRSASLLAGTWNKIFWLGVADFLWLTS